MSVIAETSLLEVTATAILIDGEEAGIAVSLGDRFVFYSSRPELAAVDGCRFSSLRQIEDRLAEQTSSS